MTELNQSLEGAAAALRDATRIVVAGHIRPDGDALGSMLALALAARAAGKEAYATFGEPFRVPQHYRFLDMEWLVPPDTDFGDVDLFVACDTAVPERLGSAAPVAAAADRVLVIDHHLSNGGFGDVTLIDPTAAATAQLVYELLVHLGWKVSEPVAVALYAGLVTDTGRFQYSSTSPRVHRIAAALLEAGVRPAEIGQRLYEEVPFGYLSVAAAVMGRAQLDEGRSLVWSTLEQHDLDSAGITYEDADALIDLVRLAREAEVACLLKEVERGVTKGSLRSRGSVDVAAVAGELGGGGHHNAAGFTFAGTPNEAIAAVRSLL